MGNRSMSWAVIENLLTVDRNVRKDQRRVLEANIRAYERYLPKKYAGDIVLFRTRALPLLKSPDPAMGWEKFVEKGVEIRKVAGTHINILRVPLIESLAKQLRPFLS